MLAYCVNEKIKAFDEHKIPSSPVAVAIDLKWFNKIYACGASPDASQG